MEAFKTSSEAADKGNDDDDDDNGYVPYVSIKKRREDALRRTALAAGLGLPRSRSQGDEGHVREETPPTRTTTATTTPQQAVPASRPLLEEAQEVKRRKMELDALKTDDERRLEEEMAILEAIKAQRKLVSNLELARGIEYTEPIQTSWRAPRWLLEQGEEAHDKVREDCHIICQGENAPPPIRTFRDMKIPQPILDHLERKGIVKPSPIQIQGLPVAFSGRDMIGIAFTGSGKTLAFSLPLLLFAIEEEGKLEWTRGEGPVGMIVCPSRELARQTYEGLLEMAEVMDRGGYPRVRPLLCIGGISMAEQQSALNAGIHMVVATPGRLQDMLDKRRITLENCRYLCLDEADRMIDMGFEDDVRNIMSYFQQQRQTLLFSATMPKKIQDFAQGSLIQPIIVNVGRAGAANLDVVQQVDYVKEEAKMVYLLECLQKTAPPVLIFSENKNIVDDMHEYLLVKGVEAVAIHGGKSQDEREYAIQSFKTYKKDVLVASDVASKGLDFSAIQHVINYDMPKEIEDYVHRIGRTGRSGKTGLATTFVNESVDEHTLLDLKYLLVEAKQRIPPFLLSIEDPNAHLLRSGEGGPASTGGSGAAGVSAGGGPGRGCAYCGGLGHSIKDCPKLGNVARQQQASAMRSAGDSGGY